MSTLPPGRRHCRPAKSSMGLPPDASLCRPVKFPSPIFTPKAVEISLQIQESVRTNLKEEAPLLALR
ncbi:hypothetical protein Tco_1188423 [Tanacetum coccineum]